MVEPIDPVVYSIEIAHWQDGEVEVTIHDIGDSPDDLKAVEYALEKALEKVRNGTPQRKVMFS